MSQSVEQIKPYLVKLYESVESGASLAAQEIPLFVQEWIMYHGFIAAFWVTLAILLFVFARRNYKPLLDKENSRFFYPNGVRKSRANGKALLSFSSTVLGAYLFAINFFIMVKLFFFPRVYLLELAMGLMGVDMKPFGLGLMY